MKTIKNSKEITTLEVGDKVVFGNLEYEVAHNSTSLNDYYYLDNLRGVNDVIFERLNINKRDFTEKLGIDANCTCAFPETKSLEALTAIVSALFKEYEKQNELPKTWEEFCKNTPIQKGECLIRPFCQIYEAEYGSRDADTDRNYFTSKLEAEAFLALMQLRQLRKAYVKGWEPDWMSDTEPKYCVDLQANDFSVQCWYHMHSPLSFPKCNLATQFLNNFKDLLEIAKPLL